MGVNHLSAQLLAYAPNGDRIGPLPRPLSWEAAVPLNDMSSLTMVYPRNSPGELLLRQPCEVALEVRNSPTTHSEPAGCRFMNIRRSTDLVDNPGNVSYSMPGYGWQLKKAHFADKAKANAEGRIVFTDATPGQVMRSVLDENKGRGNITGMVLTFSNTADSAGLAWPIKLSGEFDLGQDAWSILDTMSRQGLCDWRFNGRGLEIYAPDTTLKRDLSDSSGVIIHAGADTVSEPSDRTWEELAGRLIITGDKKALTVIDDSTGERPWGYWEEVLNAGGVKEFATMQMLGRRVLATKIHSRLQLTKQVIWRDGAPVPLLSYRPGDMIRGQNEFTPQNEPVRIYQITLSQTDPYGVVAHLTLNDRFTDRALRQERWLNRVTGNSGPGAGGGTGVTPEPPTPEVSGRTAKPPTDLQATSEPYFAEDGSPVARAKVSFVVSTQGTDGLPMDMSRYFVFARRTDEPAQTAITAIFPHPVGASPTERAEGWIYPLDSGYSYEIWAQAVPGLGYPSVNSASVTIPVGYPKDPMPKPSTPRLSSRLGTVKVEWDGLDALGNPMPARLKEVQVQMKYGSGANDWANVGEIFIGGSAVIVTQKLVGGTWVNLAVGDSTQFRFIARDTAGNASEPPSDTATITVVGVTGPDIAANAITANHIQAGAITAEKIKAYSISVDRLSIGTETNIIADPSMSDQALREHRRNVGNATQNTGGAFQWAVSSTAGAFWVRVNAVASANYGRFPLFNNVLFPLSTNLTATPPPPITVGLGTPVKKPVNGVGGNLMSRMQLVVQNSGGGAWPAGASVSAWVWVRYYDRTGTWLSDANVIPTETTTTGAISRYMESVLGAAIPEDAAFCIPVVTVETHNVPVDWLIAFWYPEMWQETSVYIGDGMITAPHIKANTITGDKMAADVIMASKYITGPWIRTDEPPKAPRVELSNKSNYLGQPGILLWGSAAYEKTASIFMTGDTSVGGWDPFDFAIVGPRVGTEANDPRVDLALGLQRDFKLARAFETNAGKSGFYGAKTSNQILMEGTLVRIEAGSQLGDAYGAFRAVFSPSYSIAAGGAYARTWVWGVNNAWAYRPTATANVSGTSGRPVAVGSRGISSTSFTLTASNTDTANAQTFYFNALCWRGGTELT